MRTLPTFPCCLVLLFACMRATAADTSASWTLTLGLRPGERIAVRTYENDRVDWKLPQKRLEHFEAAGVIINEEQHVTTTVQAKVVALLHSVAVLQGDVSIVSMDVPRHETQVTRSSLSAALAPDNMPVPATTLQVEDAAMSALPHGRLTIGEHWTTRLPVDTTLGSGNAVFDHTLVGESNGLLEISVRGQGEITGGQYHLPKLLPGTISLAGSAWYDPVSKLVVRESYAIHNRLIKPMEGEESGFDEQLSVDSSTRKL